MSEMIDEINNRNAARRKGADMRRVGSPIPKKPYSQDARALSVVWGTRMRLRGRKLRHAEQARLIREALEERGRGAVVQFDERGDNGPEAANIIEAEATSEPSGEVQPRLEVEGGVSAETPA